MVFGKVPVLDREKEMEGPNVLLNDDACLEVGAMVYLDCWRFEYPGQRKIIIISMTRYPSTCAQRFFLRSRPTMFHDYSNYCMWEATANVISLILGFDKVSESWNVKGARCLEQLRQNGYAPSVRDFWGIQKILRALYPGTVFLDHVKRGKDVKVVNPDETFYQEVNYLWFFYGCIGGHDPGGIYLSDGEPAWLETCCLSRRSFHLGSFVRLRGAFITKSNKRIYSSLQSSRGPRRVLFF